MKVREFPVVVRHYWAKTWSVKDVGEPQKLLVELVITSMMLALTAYFALVPELRLFFAGFLPFTLMMVIGTIFSAYLLISDYYDGSEDNVLKATLATREHGQG